MGANARKSKKPSRVVAAHRARREHGGTVEAIRAVDPDTLRGAAARQAGLGVVATWQARHGLLPVTATATTLAAGAVSPTVTVLGMSAVAAAQLAARSRAIGAWSEQERTAAAGWAASAAGWAGAQMVLPVGSWWQWGLGLICATGVQSAMWWKASPTVADVAPVYEPSIYERALAAVLTELSVEGAPLAGAQITGLSMPAEQVVVATMTVRYGDHSADKVSSSLARAIEARVMVPVRDSVEIEALDPTTIQVTVSWSRALDSGSVSWDPRRVTTPGQSWMGVDDARTDIVLNNYTTGEVDGKTRVHHGWLVGRTGAGKSSAATAVVLPGLAAGEEIVLVADGKGDSMDRIEPYVTRYARLNLGEGRPGDRFEQVITLAWAIMMSRKARPGGWTGPSATDPVITLLINEATSVKDNIDGRAQQMVYEIGRMGESLGVRSIQDLQIPRVEDLIGEGGWRANTRWVFGFVSADSTYSSLAAQSSNDDVSLLGLPVGRAAVIVEGQVRARKAKMVWVSETDVQRVMRGVEPAQLHPDDMAAVKPLWDPTANWPEQDAQADVIELSARDLRLTRWALGPAIASGTTAGPVTQVNPDGTTVVVTAIDDDGESMSCDDLSPGGARLQLVPPVNPLTAGGPGAGAATARDWVLTFLARTGPATAAQMLQHAPYAKSTLFDALKQLQATEAVGKTGDTYQLLIVGAVGAAQ